MVVLVATAWCAGQNNSLYQRSVQERLARTARGGLGQQEADAAGRRVDEGPAKRPLSVLKSSWITVDEPTPKEFRVHDLVTVVVNEVSKNATKADAKADREYSLEVALRDWILFKNEGIRKAPEKHGPPEVSFDFEREFDGKGDIKREDMLTARLQAQIIDVLPNGNLVLEAMDTVATDEETTTLTLKGLCRSKDVGIDNTVLSTQIFDKEIRKSHQGVARDATKRGLLTGLLDWLGIF
jgi:flagellar L-ring protein precursor FlgH